MFIEIQEAQTEGLKGGKDLKVDDGIHKSFNCTHCGKCCSFSPKLNEVDLERIKKEGFIEQFFMEDVSEFRYKRMKMLNGKCIFMEVKDGKSRCGIYSARPLACRIFPGAFYNERECSIEDKDALKGFMEDNN